MLRVAAVLCALLAAAPAAAETWQADQHAGQLRFVATQAGAKFSGHFGEFRVRMEFDAANPANARLDVTIATPSADTADAERNEVLHGRDFFWVTRFPESRYHAEGFKPEGSEWLATGTLTLRGVTQPVAIRFRLKPQSGQLDMKGSATLRRLEFGVGQGDWASTTWIGDVVDVAFQLQLQKAAASGP
jgi:polyisoprenoid-binding protein YceI